MAQDPLKRSRQRQGPSLAFHTIGVQGYFGSVQPPLSKIPGSSPACTEYATLLSAVYSPSKVNVSVSLREWGFSQGVWH